MSGIDALISSVGEHISDIINMLGLVIIARGVLKGAKSWIEDEWSMYRDGKQHMRKLMHVRRNLAVYLLLGLEFIVAADIIDTMLHLDIHTLLLLGGLIVIRVIVGYTLEKEIQEYERLKLMKEEEKEKKLEHKTQHK